MKKKVLFVGSFKDKAKDGSVGGQMYACKSLINSDLSKSIDWLLLDTTANSVPAPPVYIRLFYAVKRCFYFFFLIISKRPNSVLIFSANGPSIYEKGMMAFLASLFGIKTIISPRGGALINEIEANAFLRKFVFFIFKRVDFIVCQGMFWKSFFSDHITDNAKDKYVVIPNWIDLDQYNLDKFQTIPKNKDQNIINILFMGWIQEDKGVFDIWKALSQIDPLGHKIVITFLGDGPGRKELIEKTASAGSPFEFIFPGWVYGNEKLRFLANTDIFLLPSHAEGLPNSLMEAMACGIASIASNVGSVSDLIINNETGILIEKQDIASLVIALNSLIHNRNLRSELASKGQKRIFENHSLGKAVTKFTQIL